MTDLKLLALDGEDLAIISTHMQDAVFKVGDMGYTPRSLQFSLAANRFDWERSESRDASYTRHRAALAFKRVLAVRTQGIDRRRREDVLSLLAIRFEQKGEGPDGTIELTLSGKATVALDVECIEVQLADVGGTWATGTKPQHPEDGG